MEKGTLRRLEMKRPGMRIIAIKVKTTEKRDTIFPFFCLCFNVCSKWSTRFCI